VVASRFQRQPDATLFLVCNSTRRRWFFLPTKAVSQLASLFVFEVFRLSRLAHSSTSTTSSSSRHYAARGLDTAYLSPSSSTLAQSDVAKLRSKSKKTTIAQKKCISLRGSLGRPMFLKLVAHSFFQSRYDISRKAYLVAGASFARHQLMKGFNLNRQLKVKTLGIIISVATTSHNPHNSTWLSGLIS
jgi:hypothetical protein